MFVPGTELAFEKEVGARVIVLYSGGSGTRWQCRRVNKGQSNVHHDALELPDGKIVLLTNLCKDQRATVLQLPASAELARLMTRNGKSRS